MCWFLVGVLGLLASNGVPIPGEVNVVVAIFALPLNSALNPSIYTLTVTLGRRNKAREERMHKILSAQFQTRSTTTWLWLLYTKKNRTGIQTVDRQSMKTDACAWPILETRVRKLVLGREGDTLVGTLRPVSPPLSPFCSRDKDFGGNEWTLKIEFSTSIPTPTPMNTYKEWLSLL